MKRLWMSLALGCLASVAWSQHTPVSKMSVESSQIIQGQQKQADLWPTLQAHRVADVETGRHVARLDDIDKQWLDADLDDPEAQRMIGIEMPLDLEVDLTDELLAWADKRLDSGVGRFAVGQGGIGVWTTSLQAEGATALRLELSQFDLPEGVALYLYNDDGQAHGPYTGKGPHDSGRFWTHTVFGDHVWIQLHIDNLDAAKLEQVQFEISQVGHFGERFGLAKRAAASKADCSANLSCVENAECYDWDNLLGAARDAVARTIISIGDGYIGRCTGGLLNDTDSSGQKAWFLTANHCLGGDISSLESFFQYQSPCGSCSASYVDSVIGASIRMRNTDSDYALLELDDLPSTGQLLGWNIFNVEGQAGTNLYIVSHPKGSPQSLSQHVVVDHNSTKRIYATTVLGTTQKGSSGAPVLNDNQQVVGVHSGVTSNVDQCDYSTYRTAAGALSYFWPSVSPFLRPNQGTHSMHVSDITTSFKTVSLPFGITFIVPKVKVTVVNSLGHGIPSVTIQGTFSNGAGGTFSFTTNTNGVANFTYPNVSNASPNFTFCVNNLTHAYYNNYDSASNAVTCASN